MLSVIIINFKNSPLLRLCLKTLTNVLDPNFSREITVVDIASTVETRNVISEFSDVKLISFKENIGYTRGVNESIRVNQGDAFLILNPDVIILKDSVEKMYEYLKQNRQIGIIGPQLLNFDGIPQSSFFRFPSPWTLIYRRTFWGKISFGKKHLDRFTMKDLGRVKFHEADWLMGSAIMVSRQAVEKVGLMDERFFLYMSDIDWPRRFWENGYTVVYYPEAKMYHYHQRESRGRLGALDFLFKKESRWHLIDAVKYFKKYGIRSKSFS